MNRYPSNKHVGALSRYVTDRCVLKYIEQEHDIDVEKVRENLGRYLSDELLEFSKGVRMKIIGNNRVIICKHGRAIHTYIKAKKYSRADKTKTVKPVPPYTSM